MDRNSIIDKLTLINDKEVDGLTTLELKLLGATAEFQTAVVKYDKDCTIEETADLIIMLRQYINTIDNGELDKAIEYKLLKYGVTAGIITGVKVPDTFNEFKRGGYNEK